MEPSIVWYPETISGFSFLACFSALTILSLVGVRLSLTNKSLRLAFLDLFRIRSLTLRRQSLDVLARMDVLAWLIQLANLVAGIA